MPNTVENANIEEVLSSIRRLVSDEPSAPSAAAGKPHGRLVLTPALRIADQAEATEVARPATLPPLRLAPSDEVPTWEESTLQDRISRFEAAVAAADDDAHQHPQREAPPMGRLQLTSPILPDQAFDDDIDAIWLQNLISETIRQELKGEMGTRISRNLRKLVRREIARALAERDLT